MSPILNRYAHVAAPGVIVSTVVEAEQAHTITFNRDRRERLGYTLDVVHSHPGKAQATHDAQLEAARASTQKPPRPRPKPIEVGSITTLIHPDTDGFKNALAELDRRGFLPKGSLVINETPNPVPVVPLQKTMHRRRSRGGRR